MKLLECDEQDLGQLAQWVNDAGERLFWQWGGGAVFHFPLDDRQLRAHFQTATGQNPIRRLFKAVDSMGWMVGYLELNRIDYTDRSARVSRVLVSPEQRGKGLGFQMISALLDTAFNKMMMQSIALEVFDFNQGALRLYEKLGFQRESERQFQVLGETWTSIRMTLSRPQ